MTCLPTAARAGGGGGDEQKKRDGRGYLEFGRAHDLDSRALEDVIARLLTVGAGRDVNQQNVNEKYYIYDIYTYKMLISLNRNMEVERRTRT